MKHIIFIMALIVSLVMISCSSDIELDNHDIPSYEYNEYEVDTINLQFNVELNLNDLGNNTRAPQGSVIIDEKAQQVVPNWQAIVHDIFTDFGHKENGTYEVYDFSIDKNRSLGRDPILCARISSKKANYTKALVLDTLNLLVNKVHAQQDAIYIDDFSYRTSITLPKGLDKSDLRIEAILLNQNKHPVTNNLYYNNLSNNNFLYEPKYSLATPEQLKEYISSNSGPSLLNWLNNRSIISSPFSYYYDETSLSANNTTNVVLKINQAIVVVLTDEFNNDFYCPYLNNVNSKDAYCPIIFSSWDYKADRSLSEYYPQYNHIYNRNESNGTLPRDKSILNTYSQIIHDVESKDSYILSTQYLGAFPAQMTNILQLGWDGQWTYSDGKVDISNPYSTSLIDVISADNNYNIYHRSFFKQKSSNRVFAAVAARLVSMPFGRPKTLESASSSLYTHVNNAEDLNKEIQYLVINASYTYAKTYTGTSPNMRHDMPSEMRAVIPIPEEGFKPGRIYMIYNKPGTKLFKEWDEESIVTRMREEDIVDKSCYDIEEISM